jgi:hypothetical protein
LSKHYAKVEYRFLLEYPKSLQFLYIVFFHGYSLYYHVWVINSFFLQTIDQNKSRIGRLLHPAYHFAPASARCPCLKLSLASSHDGIADSFIGERIRQGLNPKFARVKNRFSPIQQLPELALQVGNFGSL